MKRNSSIELLRIICILGIIIMHIFGSIYSTCSGVNRIYGIGINSVFNMGVSLFMLITGYFGANVTVRKIIKFEVTLWFYGILGVLIIGCTTSYWSFKELFKALFPIATKKYWYMSVYIIILILSNYLNMLVEKLERKRVEKLLIILITFFYIMPTFFFYQIMEDNGKGLANMITVYLIGRYIKKYIGDSKISLKSCIWWAGGGCISRRGVKLSSFNSYL